MTHNILVIVSTGVQKIASRTMFRKNMIRISLRWDLIRMREVMHMTAENKIYLKISTSGLMEFRTLDDRDLNDQIHDELGGAFYEIVHPRSLSHKFLMLCDDERVLKDLPVNHVASELYGTRIHGCPICGDVLIMREYIDEEGERDICGLNDRDVGELLRILHGLIVIKEVRE